MAAPTAHDYKKRVLYTVVALPVETAKKKIYELDFPSVLPEVSHWRRTTCRK